MKVQRQLLSTSLPLNSLKISNHRLSIVAVHGLAANPDYAWVWQPKNNPPNRRGYPAEYFNWLKELLPTKLSCRVMTFNYDSNWFMNAPQQGLSSIAGTLLDSLRNEREEVGLILHLKSHS
jgi:hypothetical protein